MATVGVDLASESLVLNEGRDFRWKFLNTNRYGASEDYPPGDMFLEFATGGQHNAIQRVKITGASGGTYRLGHTSDKGVLSWSHPIDFEDLTENPTDQHLDITDALEGIPSIGPGNVELTSVGLFPTWRLELNLDQGHNEVQEIEIDDQVVSGEWRIFHSIYSTGNIEWDATPEELQVELELLTSIGPGNVSVTQGTNKRLYVIEFIGELSEKPILSLIPSQIGFGYGLHAPDPSGIWGNIGILFKRFISRSTPVPGSQQLSEKMQELIVQSINEFFNTFEELLGVDIHYTTTSRMDMILIISSRKEFRENDVLAFVMEITNEMIEGLFNGIVEFLGIFNTINIDFYWDYVYDVEFIEDLSETYQVPLSVDASGLTGLPGDPTSGTEVVISRTTEGKSPFTFWHAKIEGDTATFHEHSPAVAEVRKRVTWQLVWVPPGEDDNPLKPWIQGGDPVGRGIVTVLK